jgi:hypothetical protein
VILGPHNQIYLIYLFTESHLAGKCGSGKQDITAAIWKKLLSKAIKAKSKNEAGEKCIVLPLQRRNVGGEDNEKLEKQAAKSENVLHGKRITLSVRCRMR